MTPESKLNRRLKAYATSKGALWIKLNADAYKGFPDRLLVGTRGRYFLLETKQLGKNLADHQRRKHDDLRKRRIEVGKIDTFEDGKLYIDNAVYENPLTKGRS